MKNSARAYGPILCACLVAWLAQGPVQAQVMYVDGGLKTDCVGNYSIAKRDNSGNDGDAFNAVVKAANVAKAGDTVLIREGVYHRDQSAEECDVLWPKNSGEPGKPIVFKAREGEKVVLGEGGADYPSDDKLSIARGTITLKSVQHIVIEGLVCRKVAGWIYARNCDHIVFKNCQFEEALHDAKGTARFIECTHCTLAQCSFTKSSFDALQLLKSDHMLIEDCIFSIAQHALLAMRGSSFNVIRNSRFRNSYYENNRAEKLIEVYDIKIDRREPNNPGVVSEPVYDGAKHNLFEHNFFGYTPSRPNSGAQPSAFQYSGQNGIIRRNVFCNPPLKQPDPDYPKGEAGGAGIAMRWGGSWEGWNAKKSYWIGEGHEAGYVTHNRVFNNTFYGYNNSCVCIPTDDSVSNITVNPPPLTNENPPKQFDRKFAFEDNIFKNNSFTASPYRPQINWAWKQRIAGKPVAITMLGLLNAVRFENNNVFAAGEHADELVFVDEKTHPAATNPAAVEQKYPGTFVGNLQKDPHFVNLEESDFRLKEGSPLIDAGAFLTATVGAGKASTKMQVKDAEYFCDGFGLEGLKGDLIQLKGRPETARVVALDYSSNTLTLDKPLSWEDGLGVGLAFSGAAPDIGVYEHAMPDSAAVGPRSK